MVKKGKKKLKIWLVTVDMGYGHLRAAYPLRKLADGGLVNANNYVGIPKKDRLIWEKQRKFYEFISRFKRVPVVGDALFGIMNWVQEIPAFYPKRDLSHPNIQLLSAFHVIKSNDWGRHLIKKLSQKPVPLVTPFFATAIMAETHGYPGEIYCIICDADVSRSWVAVAPKSSRIKYFAPNIRVVERLLLYGVSKSRIFLTGFPLPEENLGGANFKTARNDLKYRLLNLDPNKHYLKNYHDTLVKSLKIRNFPKKSDHPLTLTFAVGGAGAQRELGGQIVAGLADKIRQHQIRVHLIAGIHHQVNEYFKKVIAKNGLARELGKGICILFERKKDSYFRKFNHCLRKTDILWTKPSELSFYCALGLPIIIAPPIGSQEDFNQRWLVNLGAGNKQEDPRYVDQWLFDWINSGYLAEAASQGFLEAPKLGTFNITKILAKEMYKVRKPEIFSQY